jgi:hypothetical protein
MEVVVCEILKYYFSQYTFKLRLQLGKLWLHSNEKQTSCMQRKRIISIPHNLPQLPKYDPIL